VCVCVCVCLCVCVCVSCHTRPKSWVLSHASQSLECHVNKYVMSHTCLNHVTRMDMSRRTHERNTWMSHVTHMNESCHTFERRSVESLRTAKAACRNWCVMSHISTGHLTMSHVTHEWVMAHIWMGYEHECGMSQLMGHVAHMNGTLMNESCHTFERRWVKSLRNANAIGACHNGWVMSHMWMSHGTHMNGLWTRMRRVTMDGSCRTYEWDTYEWVTLHIWMRYKRERGL